MTRPNSAVLLAVAALLLCLSVASHAANTKWSTINPLPNFTDIKDIIWDGSSYYAVGSGGLIMNSVDGLNWTPQTLGVIHQLYGIAWSGSSYVVVGDRGLVATSPDGSTWTFQTTNVTTALLTIAWSPTRGFVAGGSNGVLLTSPDGLTWTTGDSGVGAALEEIIWNNDLGQFAVVGSSGTIITSSDGISWSPPKSIPNAGLILRGIVWDGTQYVAVGSQTTVLTSPDGNKWKQQNPNLPNALIGDTLFAIAWDQISGQFVSTGTSGIIISSSDGQAWTPQNLDSLNVPLTDKQLQAITWNGTNEFIIAGVDTLLSSPDAITWTPVSSDVTGQLANLNAVAANGKSSGSGGLVVAVGEKGAVVSSANGNTWSDQTANAAAGALALNGVRWGDNKFVVVGEGGTVITSPNGSTWTAQTSNTTANLNGIARGSINTTTAIFVAVGDSGTVITSPDGITWSPPLTITTANLNAVTRDSTNSLFVAVGAGGMILTSPDGSTWTQQTSPTTQNLNGVIRGGNELVAVGDAACDPMMICNETVVRSQDGINWTAVPLETPNAAPVNLHAIDWNGTQYIVSADSGRDGRTPNAGGLLLYSQDASSGSWIPNAQITTESLRSVTWSGEQFVVVGTMGTILSSGVPDLAIKVTAAPEPAVQNQILTFASTISNTSGLIAPAVSWDYSLPSGLSFNSVTTSQGSCAPLINNLVSCALGDIDAGAEAVSVTVKVVPGQVTLANNTAKVSNNGSTNSDINTANNQATLVSTVNKEVIVLQDPDTSSNSNSVGAFNPGLLSLLLFYGWRRRCRHTF